VENKSVLFLLLFRAACLLTLVSSWVTSSIAAEFEDSEVLPMVVGVGFDKDAVGFASVERGSYLLHRFFGSGFYFIYERGSRTMVEIDAKRFHERFPAKSLLGEPQRNLDSGWAGHTTKGVKFNLKAKYCGDGTEGAREVVVGRKRVRVRAKSECTNVSSVEIVNGKLWLGTYYSGEGGYYKAEGIIVQDYSGSRVFARINTLSGWVERIYRDAYSDSVWVVTENGVYEFSPEFKILSVNLFYHDFDSSTGHPRLLFSNKTIPSNPFAVVSRLLPSEDRRGFYEAMTKMPRNDLKQFNLYDFFMCCHFGAPKYPDSLRPLAPFLIRASIQSGAFFKRNWWQSICRLSSPEARQYCQEPL
jgi:hypothetical protein